MKSFRTASLADQVYEKLEDDIVYGVYKRGEVLTELKLAETLGVSRTPIREALRRLEQERMIEDSGKGSIVLGITKEDLLDIMDIRLRIEGLATKYAAENITPEGVEELTHLMDLQDFYHSKNDIGRLQSVDDEFHAAICRLSKRNILNDTLIPLHRKTRLYRKLAMEDHERSPKTLREHREIYQAIISGDGARAKLLMKQHIENAKNHMIGCVN
ncbi:MAG: GntR family transcriptional regulator, partial [Oscillospiraceae bacterium]|nr:GntR family transcriptional regulator [Oscillospiraceae bacterium]